jgi:hypothetical protein
VFLGVTLNRDIKGFWEYAVPWYSRFVGCDAVSWNSSLLGCHAVSWNSSLLGCHAVSWVKSFGMSSWIVKLNAVCLVNGKNYIL